MKLNIVPARTGIQWVKLGLRTFMKQPLVMAGLFLLYITAVLMLRLIPLVGPIVVVVLVPAATLGLMAVTEAAASGRFPSPLILLSAFRVGRQRGRAMLILGAINGAWGLGVALVASFFMPQGVTAATTDPALQRQFANAYLVALALHIPMGMAMWHAPALVHWHGISPVKSIFFSLVAWFRNWRAFAVYLLQWAAILFTMLLVAGLLGELGKQLAVAFLLMIAAMFSTSLYFTFRDSFVAEPDAEQQPPGEPT